MKKLFLFLFCFILLINSASALVTLGEFDQNTCVRITQTCDNCTYINISSLSYPNSSIVVNDSAMNSSGSEEWYFDFCKTNLKGRYDVRGFGDVDGTKENFITYFQVGKTSQAGESLLYLLFVSILFGILLVSFYFIIALPKENDRNDNGVFVGIVKLKYLRLLLIVLSYGIIVMILNFLTGLAIQFTSFSIFAGTLGFLFEMMIRLAWPFTVIMILWVFYLLIHDSNIKKNVQKLGRYRING